VTHVVGALAELSSDVNARNTLRTSGALEPLILLLNMTHPPLLRNTAKALTQLAADPQCTPFLEELDVMRLLWSQLKSEDADVQAEAAWALCPCITNATVRTIQWNLGYTSKTGLKNLDVELRGTYK